MKAPESLGSPISFGPLRWIRVADLDSVLRGVVPDPGAVSARIRTHYAALSKAPSPRRWPARS
jgi:hypothetical protein